jgi:hypothetical protein
MSQAEEAVRDVVRQKGREAQAASEVENKELTLNSPLTLAAGSLKLKQNGGLRQQPLIRKQEPP